MLFLKNEAIRHAKGAKEVPTSSCGICPGHTSRMNDLVRNKRDLLVP